MRSTNGGRDASRQTGAPFLNEGLAAGNDIPGSLEQETHPELDNTKRRQKLKSKTEEDEFDEDRGQVLRGDLESQRSDNNGISYWSFITDQGVLTDRIISHKFLGSGTDEDPYLVEYIPEDPRNPMLFAPWTKWTITMVVAVATLAIAFVSSAYSGGMQQIREEFNCSNIVAILGISLFVLGFTIGPLLWAPMSEMYGRQKLFFGTYAALTAFNAGAAGARSIPQLLICRFFAGAFGSSPLTNAGGVIADMFPASQRGLAMAVFAAAPFMGPVLGPIAVAMLSIYMSIVYGTLYMLFAAYPIVYQQTRGWSQGVGGLPFLGVAVGMLAAVVYSIPENTRYNRVAERHEGLAPPEQRLPPALVGCVCIPIGLFWFAWSNSPDVHWFASVAAGTPFGFGMVMVFLSVFNYLIDSYTIFAASVLAANAVLRSTFGAVFPLFTGPMYRNLGIHWASSVPAFLALACVPAPFLFYKYGERLRLKCKYAEKAAEFAKKLQEQSGGSDAGTAREKAGIDEDFPTPGIQKDRGKHPEVSDADGQGENNQIRGLGPGWERDIQLSHQRTNETMHSSKR
ncbi:hypothetical protein TWF106_006742 [Orbilia oligospora]|uniref:Major facilitator superfamily (MFS) profile domain-containing protein n=1 Tax=Orbilia oligospora TaxID=2813651 RepID=A0A7C8QPQ1_ORBOL|nr:hypothetical protein TWF106_006742 [Orbilia oligospora]